MVTDGLIKGINTSSFDQEELGIAQKTIRIMLIQPPAKDGVWSFLPQVDGDEGIGYKPPQGILYIATYLNTYSSHVVEVIDCQAEQLDIKQTVEKIREFNPDLVGISAWTDFWYPSYTLGKSIKRVLPQVHINYGGPHISIYPQVTLNIDFVDSVIVGDGELPFFFLSNMIANNSFKKNIPGLHFKKDGVKSNPNTFWIQKDLDRLPFPDRTLLPTTNYSSVLGKNSYVTTMITSRGCPFHCILFKINLQKNLYRSAEDVVKEF